MNHPEDLLAGSSIRTEAASIDELIADCAQIPASVRQAPQHPLLPRLAPAWEVTDRCRAQVADLDEYV